MARSHKGKPKSGADLWTVPRIWEGEDAYLIGGGPSVANFDLKRLRGRNCIAINTSFESVPWANFIYFADHRWAAWWIPELTQVKKAVIVTTATTHRFRFPVRFLGRDRERPLTNRQDHVCGVDSGMHAVQLAYILGAKKIHLVGYDMTFEKVPKKIEDPEEETRIRELQTPKRIVAATTQVIPDVQAMSHHHKEHPTPSRLTNYERRFRPQYPVMRTLLASKGVDLVSLTPTSIEDMPVVELDGTPCPAPIPKPIPTPSPPSTTPVYESKLKGLVWHWATRSSPTSPEPSPKN